MTREELKEHSQNLHDLILNAMQDYYDKTGFEPNIKCEWLDISTISKVEKLPSVTVEWFFK